MEKEFVPYEQALALKELGFDELCLTWWHKEKFVFPYWEREFGYSYENGLAKDCVLSPLYQQAFRWFREKHNLRGHVEAIEYFDETPDTYHWSIFNECNSGNDQLTYEEAELECLKKLIEIVKNKQDQPKEYLIFIYKLKINK